LFTAGSHFLASVLGLFGHLGDALKGPDHFFGIGGLFERRAVQTDQTARVREFG